MSDCKYFRSNKNSKSVSRSGGNAGWSSGASSQTHCCQHAHVASWIFMSKAAYANGRDNAPLSRLAAEILQPAKKWHPGWQGAPPWYCCLTLILLLQMQKLQFSKGLSHKGPHCSALHDDDRGATMAGSLAACAGHCYGTASASQLGSTFTRWPRACPRQVENSLNLIVQGLILG